MSQHQQLIERTAELVVTASDNVVSRDGALVEGTTFIEQGLTSLAYLRLIDSLENEFGVYIDLEEEGRSLNTLQGLVAYMVDQGVAGTA